MIIEFTERELALIENCKVYADNNPSGMPGHNLAILVAKLARQLERQSTDSELGKHKTKEDN